MTFLMFLLKVKIILTPFIWQVQLNQEELQRIITEAKEELGCVKIQLSPIAFTAVLKYYISQQCLLLASNISSAGSENWLLRMKRRRMKELKLNLISTVTQEISLPPLQVAVNNKRVKMMTWQSMNWINTMRRIQVEMIWKYLTCFVFFFSFLHVDLPNMFIINSTCKLLVSL